MTNSSEPSEIAPKGQDPADRHAADSQHLPNEIIDDDDVQDDAVIGVAFKASLVVFACIGLIVAGAYAIFAPHDDEPVERETELHSVKSREASSVELPNVPFTDITQAAGIDFLHENGAYGQKLLPETMGGGCAFFDYDGDGDQDILLINSKRWPWAPDTEDSAREPAQLALYQNDGSGQFVNVTEAAGLDVSLYGMGVATGDYDQDGNVDFYVTCVGPNRLFRNLGDRFQRSVRSLHSELQLLMGRLYVQRQATWTGFCIDTLLGGRRDRLFQ